MLRRHKHKLLGVAGLIAVAAMLVGASSALAVSPKVWFVAGKELTNGKSNSKEIKLVSNTSFTLKVPGAGETIECTIIKFAASPKSIIWNENKHGLDEGGVEFSKCKNITKTACVVKEPIKTLGTETELAEAASGSGATYDNFKANGSKEFALIEQTGGCATTTVTGTAVAAEISAEGTEQLKHTFKFPCPPIKEDFIGTTKITLELKAFFFTAEECGEAEAELVSKENWSVK
jgi:hypothetical protein